MVAKGGKRKARDGEGQNGNNQNEGESQNQMISSPPVKSACLTPKNFNRLVQKSPYSCSKFSPATRATKISKANDTAKAMQVLSQPQLDSSVVPFTMASSDFKEAVLEKSSSNTSINMAEILNLLDDGSSCQNEIQFPPTEFGLTTIEYGYKVKKEVASTLTSILSKHEDIADSCALQTMTMRSKILECVGDIFHTLQALDFTQVATVDMKPLIAAVTELEGINVKVDWLRQRLDEICEAKECVKEHPNLMEQTDRNKKLMKQSDEELESIDGEMKRLVEKRQVVVEKRDAAEGENIKLAEKILSGKRKVGRFYQRSLVEGLH